MCLMLFLFWGCILWKSDIVGSSSITEYLTVGVSKANHSMHHYHKSRTSDRRLTLLVKFSRLRKT